MLFSNKLHLKGDDVARDMILLQDAGKDLDRGLKLFWNHLICAQTIEALDLRQIARAHDKIKIRS